MARSGLCDRAPPNLLSPVAPAGECPQPSACGACASRQCPVRGQGPGRLATLLKVTQLEVRALVGPGLGPKPPDTVHYFSIIPKGREWGHTGC